MKWMFEPIVQGKRILILGFGREGQSTYNLIRKVYPDYPIAIADQDSAIKEKHPSLNSDNHTSLFAGESYLSNINDFDVIIKSPGVLLKNANDKNFIHKLTSQTDIFLKGFSKQTIGVTGTKGKSTTASLIHHILKSYSNDTLFVGNIGVPPLDMIEKINAKTIIAFEMSSHQLEYVSASPHIAILLNLFQEHLDYYGSFEKYQLAKLNIGCFQHKGDYFIFNQDDKLITQHLLKGNFHGSLFGFSNSQSATKGCYNDNKILKYTDGLAHVAFKDIYNERTLPGKHNLMNIMAAICAAKIVGIDDKKISQSINTFKGLPHRMEYVGCYKGIHFYNDSIATIPEATIEAIQTLKGVDTLILGGKDRGIEYSGLIDFLTRSDMKNILFVGEAGKRIHRGIRSKPKMQQHFLIKSYDEIVPIITKHTKTGSICLLSPAAASYDMFKNFEERGEYFKKIVRSI